MIELVNIPAATVPTGQPKRSSVEQIKEKSQQLRGTIAQDLVRDSDHFSEADKQLLKFHGSYQQDDRDARKGRKKDSGKHYMFMIRCKIPGGRLTADQYLAMDRLAETYANGTIRFTTRQSIQLHGVLKGNLKKTIAGINESLLSTLGACGDVERNVMACPAPHHHHGVRAQLQETACILAAHLAPRTRSYHEIWLDGELIEGQQKEVELEPIYGKVYLPRKFKTGLALPEDNCIDIYSQDLGLLAIVENGAVAGYNLLVGGGMGMTHGNANTFPHLAKPICYVPAVAVIGAAEAVVKLFRDHGNRADRKRARIKYLVHDWGVEKFRQVLSDYVGGSLHQPLPIEVRGFDPHLGWNQQGNGKWYYGLSIENGRVKDDGSLRLRTGLRNLVERLQPALRLTPLQDILLCDLDAGAREEIERTLAECGVLGPDQLSTVQKLSMACPAMPTCGLALSESERVFPGVIDQLEKELQRLGLQDEKLSVRMTGCPNGCARPYQSDIGIVGRSGDKYTLFVGGHVLGTRLNFMLRDLVPLADIVSTLRPVLEHFKKERQSGESFGDYCHRLGVDQLTPMLPAAPEKDGHESLNPGSNGNSHGIPEGHPNGHSHSGTATLSGDNTKNEPALAEPATRLIPLGLLTAEESARPPTKLMETFLTGRAGEEQPDYTYRYNSDGSIRETVVYFYADDLRSSSARAGDPLRREAVYLGKAEPYRLYSARKLTDTYYVGLAEQERRDRRIEYDGTGGVARTVLFYYEDGLRAADAPFASPLRWEVVHEGKVAAM